MKSKAITPKKLLEDLVKEVKDPLTGIRNTNCQLCPLHVEAKTVCMFGVHPRDNSKIMIVGEAPGETEDRIGEPFAGASGIFLLNTIEEIAPNLGDCLYITNAVKCRPRNNTVPDDSYIDICAGNYLVNEILHYKPKVILSLGNSALYALVGKKQITKNRGMLFRRELYPEVYSVLPTYHPSYLIRKGGFASPDYDDWMNDIRLAIKIGTLDRPFETPI